MLTVEDADDILDLAWILECHDVDVEYFREPDMGNVLTAIAASGPIVERKLSKLPLMLERG